MYCFCTKESLRYWHCGKETTAPSSILFPWTYLYLCRSRVSPANENMKKPRLHQFVLNLIKNKIKWMVCSRHENTTESPITFTMKNAYVKYKFFLVVTWSMEILYPEANEIAKSKSIVTTPRKTIKHISLNQDDVNMVVKNLIKIVYIHTWACCLNNEEKCKRWVYICACYYMLCGKFKSRSHCNRQKKKYCNGSWKNNRTYIFESTWCKNGYEYFDKKQCIYIHELGHWVM